jgi:hypothetical protein
MSEEDRSSLTLLPTLSPRAFCSALGSSHLQSQGANIRSGQIIDTASQLATS